MHDSRVGLQFFLIWLTTSHVLRVTVYVTGPESMGFGIVRALHFGMDGLNLLYQVSYIVQALCFVRKRSLLSNHGSDLTEALEAKKMSCFAFFPIAIPKHITHLINSPSNYKRNEYAIGFSST
jgi:hypothetical protein